MIKTEEKQNQLYVQRLYGVFVVLMYKQNTLVAFKVFLDRT